MVTRKVTSGGGIPRRGSIIVSPAGGSRRWFLKVLEEVRMAICGWVGSASEADHVRCGGHHGGGGRAWPSHAGRSGVVPSMAVPLRRQSVDFGRGGRHRLAV